MKPRHTSYLGITDFTDASQVHRMRDVLDEIGSQRLLGVGVMMSYKTLTGRETKWSKWFPPNEQVASIFVERAGVFNVLHYADYDGATEYRHLRDAIVTAGRNVDALQLDMPWPDLAMLRRIRNMYPNLKFIIQVSEKAIEQCGRDAEQVVHRLTQYAQHDCLDYALFDLSGGQGKAMNANLLMNYIWKAVQALPSLSIAVAGGLGPTSMDLLKPAIRDGNPLDVSIDAQGKLRPSGKADQEHVDWDMAEAYLRAAEAMLRSAEA